MVIGGVLGELYELRCPSADWLGEDCQTHYSSGGREMEAERRRGELQRREEIETKGRMHEVEGRASEVSHQIQEEADE